MEDIRAIEDKTKEELDQVNRPVDYLMDKKLICVSSLAL
jgi:hypothetical protein